MGEEADVVEAGTEVMGVGVAQQEAPRACRDRRQCRLPSRRVALGRLGPGVSRFGLSRSRPRRGALDTCLMMIDGGNLHTDDASPF